MLFLLTVLMLIFLYVITVSDFVTNCLLNLLIKLFFFMKMSIKQVWLQTILSYSSLKRSWFYHYNFIPTLKRSLSKSLFPYLISSKNFPFHLKIGLFYFLFTSFQRGLNERTSLIVITYPFYSSLWLTLKKGKYL